MIVSLRMIISSLLLLSATVFAFTDNHKRTSWSTTKRAMTSDDSSPTTPSPHRHPFCDLPGDPSLMLTTNVDLGSKKMEIMKGE